MKLTKKGDALPEFIPYLVLFIIFFIVAVAIIYAIKQGGLGFIEPAVKIGGNKFT
ncbi:MAG: hypothetical protein J4451_01725 [DPANN group archaeon]|nr:hypothetical protein [DPANN group archaeon]